jgi:hypothetical protein
MSEIIYQSRHQFFCLCYLSLSIMGTCRESRVYGGFKTCTDHVDTAQILITLVNVLSRNSVGVLKTWNPSIAGLISEI